MSALTGLFVPNIIVVNGRFYTNSHLINSRANDNLGVQICLGIQKHHTFSNLIS